MPNLKAIPKSYLVAGALIFGAVGVYFGWAPLSEFFGFALSLLGGLAG